LPWLMRGPRQAAWRRRAVSPFCLKAALVSAMANGAMVRVRAGHPTAGTSITFKVIVARYESTFATVLIPGYSPFLGLLGHESMAAAEPCLQSGVALLRPNIPARCNMASEQRSKRIEVPVCERCRTPMEEILMIPARARISWEALEIAKMAKPTVEISERYA